MFDVCMSLCLLFRARRAQGTHGNHTSWENLVYVSCVCILCMYLWWYKSWVPYAYGKRRHTHGTCMCMLHFALGCSPSGAPGGVGAPCCRAGTSRGGLPPCPVLAPRERWVGWGGGAARRLVVMLNSIGLHFLQRNFHNEFEARRCFFLMFCSTHK